MNRNPARPAAVARPQSDANSTHATTSGRAYRSGPARQGPDPDRLLDLAYRAAARVIRNPVLAEEAGERAVHRFQLALLSGEVPDRPEAWITTVARRSACAILRNGWARTQPIADEGCLVAEPRHGEAGRRGDRLRSLLARALTDRQHEALEAALTCRTTREAARTCRMEPRDFRRYLQAISRRARRRLGDLADETGLAHDPASGRR